MSATSTHTSYKATSRSLNTSFTTKGTEEKQRSKRQSLNGLSLNKLGLLVVLFLMVFALGRLDAAEAQNNGKRSTASDILRQDILRFVGPVTEQEVQNATVPQDSFLVQLDRNGGFGLNEVPKTYGMLVRGIDAVEQAMLQDAKDGKWDNFDLFRAAMVVEGIRDPNTIRAYEMRLDSLRAQVEAKLRSNGRQVYVDSNVYNAALTRELFEALHRELLTSPYDINCTNLGRVFETGHFNCVSATVLFNALGEKAGLDVYALEMPGHALSRVKFGGESINLETTCPNWFSLQSNAARTQATLSRTAGAVSTAPATPNPPTGNLQGTVDTAETASQLNDLSKKLREITPVQLIATIYYNQGVDFLHEKRYAEAAAANIKALHLDPTSETAWGNLMATINNWAIELTTEAKRYDLAATLLDQGVYLDPNYEKFRANQLHVYYHWIRDLALEGRTVDAQTVFGLADQRLPNDPDLANLMQAILKKN